MIGKNGDRIREIKSLFKEEGELVVKIPSKVIQESIEKETVDVTIKAFDEEIVEKCSKLLELLKPLNFRFYISFLVAP